ncbi:hypothetical protein POVWA2_011410 [Plasmodium ovale wallikeri]|uniref:Uncharacterized protein n=1 Tax=Plasmodium ovale wallikeri TaxID=864142 RepID=A0A1A8YL37_PLAOA|nr:hypothetical protein POVWA1_011230 [Plasmodium ovale wallikeri]SBT32762.1 hypothetical protein POVWA2_011410 [Plasmodium ovale wallikeri]
MADRGIRTCNFLLQSNHYSIPLLRHYFPACKFGDSEMIRASLENSVLVGIPESIAERGIRTCNFLLQSNVLDY